MRLYNLLPVLLPLECRGVPNIHHCLTLTPNYTSPTAIDTHGNIFYERFDDKKRGWEVGGGEAQFFASAFVSLTDWSLEEERLREGLIRPTAKEGEVEGRC